MIAVLKWTVISLGSNEETIAGEASIGLKIPKEDRDRYLTNDGSLVHLHLITGADHSRVDFTPPPSFWDATIELTNTEIRAWFDKTYSLAKGSDRKRPKVVVCPTGRHSFAVLGFED